MPVCDLVLMPAKPASDHAVKSQRSPEEGRKIQVSRAPCKYQRIFFDKLKDHVLNFVSALLRRLTKYAKSARLRVASQLNSPASPWSFFRSSGVRMSISPGGSMEIDGMELPPPFSTENLCFSNKISVNFRCPIWTPLISLVDKF